MPALPTDPLTRLAELETRLQSVETELRATRRRGAEHVAVRETWPAITAEHPDRTPTYPRYDDTDADQLPVIMLDGKITAGVLSWLSRSLKPSITALSPIGWLPPATPIQVGWDGTHWRIVSAPRFFHGKSAATGISAAQWDYDPFDELPYYGSYYCDDLTLGYGYVHLYKAIRTDTRELLVPHYYLDGSQVLNLVYNTMTAVDGNKLLSLEIDRDLRWIVVIDPCNFYCE